MVRFNLKILSLGLLVAAVASTSTEAVKAESASHSGITEVYGQDPLVIEEGQRALLHFTKPHARVGGLGCSLNGC
jgi:hypothetical protein